MSRIVLSIILPLYQAEKHVEDIFRCLAQQKGIVYKNVEIILWNDGSTDKTEEGIQKHLRILDQYASVRIFNSEQNQGLFATRLAAAQKARGKFITFIDKQTRPYPDYLFQLLSQKWPLVVGNPVMDKTRSPWDRILFLIRKKLYYPYFGIDFPDLTLTFEQYRHFKNKGGGGAMLVRRDWFLEIAQSRSLGKYSNDDSQLIEKLTVIWPLRKTAKAKMLYLNRTGFVENIQHLFWRGPKFIDYYLRPKSRYFPIIAGGLFFVVLQPTILLFQPLFLTEVLVGITVFLVISLWLSEEASDFAPTLVLLPITVAAFSLGCLYGIFIKLYTVVTTRK
jgi:glycosyltransferase involved in cell wall biosynthesis